MMTRAELEYLEQLYRDESAELEAISDRVTLEAQLEEELEEQHPGERFGFGVCATGRCDEPCGPNGGCMRGARRRRRGR